MSGLLSDCKVLIVDDEVELAVLLGFLLTTYKLQTDLASSGEEALLKLREQKFDYIISDVRMPEMNGAELYHKVQEEFENPPYFLFITGFDSILTEEIIDNSLGRFSKPLDHEAIVEVILAHRKSLGKNNHE